MSADALWAAVDAREAERVAAKAEVLRAERERDLLAKIPDASERVCCTLRFAPVVCEDECEVIAGVLG